MRVSLSEALRITVAYGNIFNYPLTREEIRYWCVYRVLPKRYKTRNALRRRGAHSRHKWEIARRVARQLRTMPTVELIGVTGALAMDNANQNDDIDFLIITKPRTLWTTRMLITIFLDLISVRRRPGDSEFRDKICLNMFISADALSVPKHERDLFTAHEVLQMKPLWDKNGMYQKFLNANSWVEKFLPTAWRSKNNELRIMNYGKDTIFLPILHTSYFILRLVEPLARALQLWYMQKRRTTEVISDTVIRFHPVDARVWIYRELQKRLQATKIPLDKIFYGR